MSRAGAGQLRLAGVLVLLGAGWGLVHPMAKIAVSDGYRHFGISFWQLLLGAALLGLLNLGRGRALPLGRRPVAFYLLIALIGTVFPNAAIYQAAAHLPAGLMAIMLSLVPLLAFPMALALTIDRFAWHRLAGLLLGLCGVALIALPDSSLPSPAMAAWLPVALVPAVFYALEGNVIARWGTGGLDPVQLLLGASIIGAILTLPLAVASGHWIDPRPPWHLPDLAILAIAGAQAYVYAGYVWLVGRAGATFAAQVAYLVTGFGVLWSMLLLGERYSGWIWVALALILGGLFLVQPRPKSALAGLPRLGKDAAG